MSGTHADSERPRPGAHDARDRAQALDNDTTALNGGPARHWFLRAEGERLPTPRTRSKLGVAVILWGTLLLGVLIMVAAL